MKKVFSLLSLFLLLTISLSGCKGSGSGDCSELTDVFCAAFDKMTADVNKVSTLDEFANLDFEKSLRGLEDSVDLPESCLDEEISDSEKEKIQKSIDKFINSVVNKTASLSGGEASTTEVELTFAPMRAMITKLIQDSDTYMDLCKNMENI